jgi:hypothetical protein
MLSTVDRGLCPMQIEIFQTQDEIARLTQQPLISTLFDDSIILSGSHPHTLQHSKCSTRRMLPSSRRIATCAVRQFIHPPSSLSSSSSIAAIAVSRRYYAAKAHGPEPKLDPLSPPIPGELDPRFGDLPPWNVPEVNRQNLTETPLEPYYDVQNRRYYGEPVPSSLQS